MKKEFPIRNSLIPENKFGLKGMFGVNARYVNNYPVEYRFKNSDNEKFEPIDWYSTSIPTYKQTISSCGGEGTGNIIEDLLRLRDGVNAIPEGYQVNGTEIYYKAREIFHGDRNPDAGLGVNEGMEAAIESGVLPKDTEIFSVDPNPKAIAESLKISPLGQGLLVNDAWLDPGKTGEIKSGMVNPFNALGGHFTVIEGAGYKDGKPFFGGLNSWGMSWSDHGRFYMSYEDWWYAYRWINEGPYGFKMGPMWYDGFKIPEKWFIKKTDYN